MPTAYVARGLKTGLVAGLAFGVFVAFVGDPLVGLAERLAHGAGHHGAAGGHADGAVPASVTAAVSVGAGVVWGLLAGGVTFGVAYYFLEPCIPGASDTRSYLLAAAGFVTVSGAPWLVLPPQPAGVEQGLPTDVRLSWYAGMMVAGAAVCLLSGYAFDRVRAERERPTALLAAALPFALLAVPALLAPANPIHGAPSDLLVASYRGVVAVGQAVLWFTLAGAHAWLVRRDRTEASPGRQRIAAVDPAEEVSAD